MFTSVVNRTIALTAIAVLTTIAWQVVDARGETAFAPLPQHLHETGLYADASSLRIDPSNLEFSPQYPLWSDGARKRRWIHLPPGAAIDASNVDAWEFPVGTRLWKEFALDRPIETRFAERLSDGTWRFATYIWNEEGTAATLAASAGIAALETNGATYSIPAQADCRACHEGTTTPVLGFSALQLSPDRDPLAPHAEAGAGVSLLDLVSRGLIKNLPEDLIRTPPRIAAKSPVERAALGYLHGNCAHCHNDSGVPAPVDLMLSQSANSRPVDADRVLRSLVNAPSRFRGHRLGDDAGLVTPGRADRSVLIARMGSRDRWIQMPPLGTDRPDTEGLALIERWIAELPLSSQETHP
jgi:cytochrome c553